MQVGIKTIFDIGEETFEKEDNQKEKENIEIPESDLKQLKQDIKETKRDIIDLKIATGIALLGGATSVILLTPFLSEDTKNSELLIENICYYLIGIIGGGAATLTGLSALHQTEKLDIMYEENPELKPVKKPRRLDSKK